MKASIDLKKLSSKPGCYLFKNADNDIIYIGKAINLKKRVSSYFQKKEHDEKTRNLIHEIHGLDFIITHTELEALLLEAQLIQQHKPKYNIDLRAGERYAYIKVTDEEFPRLVIVRKKEQVKKRERLYGPFASGQARQIVVELLNRTFLIRACQKLPKKECLLFHIHRCSAPCIQNITREEYMKNVKKAEIFLKGRVRELIRELNEEMIDFSKKQAYEKAKMRRDQINALVTFEEKQKVNLSKSYNQDVINYVAVNNEYIAYILHIQKGIVTGKKEFTFEKEKASPSDFLFQYYFSHPIPDEIIIPDLSKSLQLFQSYVSEIAKKQITITIPRKGDKKKLLDLVKENIESKIEPNTLISLSIQSKLGLPTVPQVIECFDISNIGENYKVGSMVSFYNGQPDKNNYRRFKIKTVVGQSDVDCMHEIVYRRYKRVKEQGQAFPDLIIVDGGKAQLSGAQKALNELKLAIPMIGLAKKREEIYIPGKKFPLLWDIQSSESQLFQRIRDEAHRFAITYHRLLREKGLFKKNVRKRI